MPTVEERIKRCKERELKRIDALEKQKQKHRTVMDDISKKIVRIRIKAIDERDRIHQSANREHAADTSLLSGMQSMSKKPKKQIFSTELLGGIKAMDEKPKRRGK